MYSKQVTPFLLERVDSKIMITRKYVRYNIFYLIFLLYDCNIYLAKKSDYDSKWVNKRGCEKRIVPKKKKDQEFIMNSRSFFLL